MTMLADVDRTAAAVYRVLERAGGPLPVVVGDALVAIYAPAAGHQPGDLDLVVPGWVSEVHHALVGAGWLIEGGHCWHPDVPLPVDLVGSELLIRGQPAGPPARRTSDAGDYLVLSPTDAIADRLAGWLHWRSARDRALAALILEAQTVETNRLASWLEAEGADASELACLTP